MLHIHSEPFVYLLCATSLACVQPTPQWRVRHMEIKLVSSDHMMSQEITFLCSIHYIFCNYRYSNLHNTCMSLHAFLPYLYACVNTKPAFCDSSNISGGRSSLLFGKKKLKWWGLKPVKVKISPRNGDRVSILASEVPYFRNRIGLHGSTGILCGHILL